MGVVNCRICNRNYTTQEKKLNFEKKKTKILIVI